jgi:hypothetical protein
MDDMEVWGQNRSYVWYCDVLDFLANTVVDGAPIPKKQIISQCIEMFVVALINKRFFNSPVHNVLMREWEIHFARTYSASEDFATLLVNSEQLCLSECLRQLIAESLFPWMQCLVE